MAMRVEFSLSNLGVSSVSIFSSYEMSVSKIPATLDTLAIYRSQIKHCFPDRRPIYLYVKLYQIRSFIIYAFEFKKKLYGN